MIKVKHDREAKALYVALEIVPLERRGGLTMKRLAPGVHADYDGDKLVGLEILSLKDERIKIVSVRWPNGIPRFVQREKRRR